MEIGDVSQRPAVLQASVRLPMIAERGRVPILTVWSETLRGIVSGGWSGRSGEVRERAYRLFVHFRLSWLSRWYLVESLKWLGRLRLR